jgi:AcrR family transcriptional regulator
MTATTTDGRMGRAHKREAILDAASDVFLRNGYVGASMDEVAALAGVSKQTVYKHFGAKERLFEELVTATVRSSVDAVHAELLRLDGSDDVPSQLRQVARGMLARVMQPELIRLRRLVIGEAGRFPHLGKVFYDLGPGRAMSVLADAFARLAEAGVLAVDDPRVAAEHFNWLVVSIPLNRAMILGDDEPATRAQLRRYADAGVDVFLAAYGTHT